MTDLHTRLRSAIEERLALAQAATEGPWEYDGNPSATVVCADERRSLCASAFNWPDPVCAANARHIAANSPDRVIRACRADLARLERHRPYDDGACHVCVEGWLSEQDSPYGWWCPPEPSPCPEVRSLAEVWEVEL